VGRVSAPLGARHELAGRLFASSTGGSITGRAASAPPDCCARLGVWSDHADHPGIPPARPSRDGVPAGEAGQA